MKLLIVTCLNEDKQEVTKLLSQAGISVYSVSETTGNNTSKASANPLVNWFGNASGEFDSLFFFSFTDDATAASAVKLVNQRNQSDKDQFPVHAFVLPVESFSQIKN